MKPVFRQAQAGIFLTTSLVLLTAFYLQYIEALEPCPLCLMQRGMMFGLLFFAFLGCFLKARRGLCVLAGFELVMASGGVFFALRQLWLQSLPVADTGMCLPGVELLIHRLPWHEVLQAFLWGGTTGCGEVSWTFGGLSMAAWSAFYFGVMGVLSLVLLVRLVRYERVSN